MNYKRWTPIVYFFFGAITLVNGILSFQSDGVTLGTILLLVGGGLMVVVTTPALFGSSRGKWSLPESTGKLLFFGSLLVLVLCFSGIVLLVVN